MEYYPLQVRASYEVNLYPDMDKAIEQTMPRVSDFAGMGSGVRDHGWNCKTQFEADGLLKRLKKLNLNCEIKETPHDRH